MSEQTAPSSNPNASPAAFAKELGDLRQHFAPISIAASLPDRAETLGPSDPFVDRRSPLPLDDPFVQQTKDQIRLIVDSIVVLSRSPIEPIVFLNAALEKVVQAMAAAGAAIWEHRNDEWRLLVQLNLPEALIAGNLDSAYAFELSQGSALSSLEQLDLLETQLDTVNETFDGRRTDSRQENPDDAERLRPSHSHRPILDAVAREKQPVLIPPNHVSVSADRPANPIDQILIFAPILHSKGQGQLWLQVIQSPSGGPSNQRGYLRFAAQMADKLAEYFRTHDMRMLERDRACVKIAQQTLNSLSESVNAKSGLAKLMNMLRQHAGSEHALMLRRTSRFGRWRLEAAAGLVEIDRRADGIEQIERVAGWMHTNAKPDFVYKASELTGNIEQRDPDLTVWLNTFAVSRFAWIHPFRSTAHPGTTQSLAILLTWSGLDEVPANCCSQCSMISRLGLSTLQLPWWKLALARQQNEPLSVRSRFHPAAWSGWIRWTVCLLIAAAVLLFPVPIKMHATAVLIPTLQQHVYAPQDCIVEQVLVEHGDQVHAGQVLVKLRSTTLAADFEQTRAQHIRDVQQLDEVSMRLLRDKSLTAIERDELEGEKVALEATLRTQQRILSGLQEQLDRMQVVASIDGVVATWNLKENLRDRPVRMGQWLLTLHDAKSDWFFEASFPEQDSHDFQLAIQKTDVTPMASLNASPQTLVPLRYSKDSNRVDRLVKNREIWNYSDRNAIEPVLRVRFDVDARQLPEQGITAGASAKVTIPTGRGPLIWALSKDMIRRTWAQFRMWI